MVLEIRKDLSIVKKSTVILYLLYNFLTTNFLQYNLNDETLEGSINVVINDGYFNILINIIIMLVLLYLFLKGNKLVTTLISLGGFLNIIFALMMIETNNLSMYNVTLIINIVLSLFVVFFLRPRI
ncbi:MAG: hypothetical protein RSG52_05555 [Terrisporobacter sp.]|uniref:hypothetical protein n=1 Tax=Terrisporobacter sp. TaxID=1965305 RepID=UPI002FC66CE8